MTPSTPPRRPPTVALAGAGDVSALHGLAARALGLEVVAVADDDGALARARAEQVGARACRPGELPAGAEVVVVTGPVARRAADATRCLAAGATVVVEPPLCATPEEAVRLGAVDAAQGGRLWHGEHLAFAPVVASALHHAGQLGPLVHVEVRAAQPRPVTAAPGGIGALAELAPRPLGLCLLLAGATPTEVRAEVDEGGGRAAVHLAFPGGAGATVAATWSDEAAWDVQAASATGVVRAELAPTPGLERDGDPLPLPGPRHDLELPQLGSLGYLGLLEAVVAARAEGRPASPGAALGGAVVDVVAAARASVAAGGAPRAVGAGSRADQA